MNDGLIKISFFKLKLSAQKKIYKQLKSMSYFGSFGKVDRLKNENFRILNGNIVGACGVNLSEAVSF